MPIKTYPIRVEEERWEEIKSTIPRGTNLNDAIVDRLDAPIFKGRSADDRGRVSLPSDEYAGKEVDVAVFDAREPEEEDDA